MKRPTPTSTGQPREPSGETAEAKQSERQTGMAEPTSGAGENACVIVGVGASAGGLEAFTELLKPLPEKPEMAFVLIPHLDPKHESALTELLGRATKMQVRQVHDQMKVTPNCVYVIPPNRVMTIRERVLRLRERHQESGPPMPIDAFLRSLAEDCGSNAIGVILSGTASDGTLGIAAIKHEGGITFAQDTATAKYPGMPNSAVSSGYVDFVLPPDEIARELLRIREHPYVNHGAAQRAEAEQGAEFDQGSEMEVVFRLLKRVRKVDFSGYKPGTIRRRVLRRMALAHVDTLGEYIAVLQRTPKEVEALHHDMLINVTSFFRDPEAFEALQEIVYPTIFEGRQAADTIRVWVPGCSTGEETYSHAIALLEYASTVHAEVSIQIFGTDLSEPAVRTARAGIYKESIAADVSPSRLRRFFNQSEQGYQVSKMVRDMCIFATQNVFNDPPFSHMDLVSCRNILIYLSPELQRRVIPIFHYALKPAGFLMVGNTEGIVGAGTELFEAAHRRHKIYRKSPAVAPVAFSPPRESMHQGTTNMSIQNPAQPHVEAARTPGELQREADRLLLTRYVPSAVVVNDQFDVLQVRGRANRYLELPSGKATLNLLKMAKPGLLFELQTALEQARSTASPVRKDNVQVEVNSGFHSIVLEVIPFQAPLQPQLSFIIVFEEDVPGAPRVEPPHPPSLPEDAKDRQVAHLKQELGATKEYLQSIIEALEASNEELQSANEEIQSGNEELQSTNEELQTSKEELESANEELNTVNEEMQHRNAELLQANNDMVNLLASVNIPILMLDSDLNIRRMTPQLEEVLGVTPADLGRSIRHIRFRAKIANLEQMMTEVIQDLQPRDVEVHYGQNHRYRMRITPYRTMDNHIEGVVLAFVDLNGVSRRVPGNTKKRVTKGDAKTKKK
jgi:two-component system CheB/CheR fusion protein